MAVTGRCVPPLLNVTVPVSVWDVPAVSAEPSSVVPLSAVMIMGVWAHRSATPHDHRGEARVTRCGALLRAAAAPVASGRVGVIVESRIPVTPGGYR